MTDWEERRLGDLVEVNPREKVPRGAFVPTLDMAAVPAWSRKHLPFQRKAAGGGTRFRNGDTLVARITPCLENGKTCQVSDLADGEVGVGSTEFVALRAIPEETDPDFIFYLARSDPFRDYAIQRMTGTSGRQRVSSALIADFRFRFPSHPEQRAIAEMLGALDDKIGSNSHQSGVLDQLVKAHYAIAVQGSEEVPALEPLRVEFGSAFKGDHFCEAGQGRPLIRIRDLRMFQPEVWTLESRNDERVVTPGDVLIGMDAEFRSHLWLGASGLLNQRVCRVSPRPGVSRAFALHAVRPGLAQAEHAKTGTTVIHLNKSDIEEMRAPHLSADEHHRLAGLTDPLIDFIVELAVESRLLRSLRDALLPELLSGRIRVPEAREILEDAS
jgi:type I restriction enzyme S subunit